MRIALLTTTLEPGRCGVGDFTRRVATDLVAAGHEVLALAFRDGHLQVPARDDSLAGLSALRLPAHAWSAAARSEARVALEAFGPEVVSLQISPYGLGYHGMLFSCLPWFERLLAGLPLHIMYHELWIGGTRDAPWRQVVEGALQQRLLGRFHRRLAPQAASCSSSLARAMLGSIGIEASVAPIPTGIPVAPMGDGGRVPSADPNTRRLALFGSIPPEWDWRGSLGPLCQAISGSGPRAELVQLGRPGYQGRAIWAAITAAARELPATTLDVGETDALSLSHWLQTCDAGLSLTPLEALGKSSAAGAYRAHGLPIIGLRDPLRLRPIQGRMDWPPDPGAVRADATLFAQIRAGEWPVPATATATAGDTSLADVLGRWGSGITPSASSASVAVMSSHTPKASPIP